MISKKMRTIYMDDKTFNLLTKIARFDQRSRSNVISVAICEYARQFDTGGNSSGRS